MTTTRLAIDLGTSHTVGVVRRDGQPVRALLFDGSPLLPSGVAVDPDGTLHTGRDAERVAQVAPERFEPHPKRRIDEGAVLLGERVVEVSDMLAAILARVMGEAINAGVTPGGATVLTCPADWGGPRRDVLREAARRAGFGDVVLVDEPVAAAAYCMAVVGQRLYTGQALAVFDFGGGTLDVTVVRRDPDQLRVLATGGLDDLGGLDVDAAVVGHLGHLVELRDPGLWQRLQAPADPAQARDRRAFWAEARAAKEMLSRTSSAPVQVPGRPDALHLTRDELERIAGPLIARAVDETRRVVERAGLGVGTLAGILLVGGSSRIPLVASRLHARMGVAPTTPEQPELPVAHGALVLAEGGAAVGGYTPPATGRIAGPPGRGAPQPGTPPHGIPASGAPASGGGPVSGGWSEQGTVSGSPLFGSPISGPPSAAPYAGGPVSGSPSSPSPASPAGSRYPSPAGAPNPSAAGSPYAPPGPWPPGAPVPGAQTPGARLPGPPVAGPPVAGSPGAGPPGAGAGSPASTPWPPATKAGRKRGTRRLVVSLVVVVLVVALGLTGLLATVFRSAANGFGVPDALDNLTGSGGSGEAGELTLVHDVAVGAGGRAVATDGAMAYYAASAAETTKVVALPAAGGKAKWTSSVKFGAGDLTLTVTGGVLILDGGQSTLDGDARAVLDADSGKVLWAKAWPERVDMAYVGSDALVELRRDTQGISSAVARYDLRTGRQRWKVKGPDDLVIIDSHLAKVARSWPAPGAARKPADPVSPPAGNGFKEALVTSDDIVMLAESDGKGKVIDGASGKVRRTASLPLDDEQWTVWEGLVIGQVKNTTAVAAYRLSDLGRAWRFPLTAGSSIDVVRPCGPKLVCVVADTPGTSDAVVHAFDTARGKEVWQRESKDKIDTGWYLVAGQLILGEDSFGAITEPVLLEPGNKVVREYDGQSFGVIGSDAARMLTRTARLDGTTVVWQVGVTEVGSGKHTPGVDVGTDLPAGAALAGDTLVVLSAGANAHVRVYRIKSG